MPRDPTRYETQIQGWETEGDALRFPKTMTDSTLFSLLSPPRNRADKRRRNSGRGRVGGRKKITNERKIGDPLILRSSYTSSHLQEDLAQLYDTKTADEVETIPAKVEEAPKPRRKSRIVERGYERKHKLVDLAKRRADYRCEVADCAAELFTKPDGQRYVEVHHLIGMAEGGPDTLENLVCVCANHHRELHYGERKEELKKQLQQLRGE